MLERYSRLMNIKVQALDAEFGAVSDIYVDATTWNARYVVVDTRKWMPSPSVLIAPDSIVQLRNARGCLEVNLTREQVERAPLRETHEPISRQYEARLFNYYGWMPYWTVPPAAAWPFPYPYSTVPEESPAREGLPEEWTALRTERFKEDPTHELRSLKEVQGYAIHAIDDRFGKVDDFMIDTDAMTITDLLLDATRWLPGGGGILCPSFFVTRVDYVEQEIEVSLHRKALETAPKYDEATFGRSFHEKLLRHYAEAGRAFSPSRRAI